MKWKPAEKRTQGQCDVSRCASSTSIYYSTQEHDVGMCDKHWSSWCSEEEERGTFMTMCGLTFNGPNKPWPGDKCNSRRCIADADYRYRNVDLWPGKHPSRDIVLCQKHATAMQKANEKAGVPVPQAEILSKASLAHSANAALAQIDQSPVGLLRQAVNTMKVEALQYLDEFQAAAADDLAAVSEFEIDGDEHVEMAGEFLASVKKDLKELDDHRKERGGIFGKVKQEVDSWYKSSKETLEQTKSILEAKLKTHRQKGIEEQQRLIQEAQDANSPEVVKGALVAASDATQRKVDGMSYIDRWKFKVVDASAVPAEFLCPDLAKIGEHVRLNKEATSIPGIEVYNDPIVRNG